MRRRGTRSTSSPRPGACAGVIGGETVVDSCHVALLHETGYLPIWYFPRSDVRFDLLEATEHTTHCPFKGDARYWTIRVGRQGRREQGLGLPRDPARDAAHHAIASRSTGTPSSTGTRRTRRSSSTRAIRITASTWCRARATCASRWTASCWPSRAGRWRASRPTCRRAGTSPRRTSSPATRRRRAARAARTRASRPTGAWAATTTSPGATRTRSPTAAALRGLVSFYDEVVDVDIDGERQERGYSPFAQAGALKDRGVAAQVGSNA